jgi:ABC-type transport system involved in cytochrome bd biosynthesis fused ATPase/permease subunit
MDPYQVRKYFSVVSQNVKLFSANLRENLLLANSQATDDQLVKVLRQVELEDWFSHLPDGMNTWIGDQGYKLSGGERQRLAIARALLQDRPFLLLDEPVEHLDTKMAERLIDTVFQLFDTGASYGSHTIMAFNTSGKQGDQTEKRSNRIKLAMNKYYRV